MDALRMFWFRVVSRLLGRRVTVGAGTQLANWLELDGPGTVIIGENCLISTMPGARREHVTLFTNTPDAVIRIGNGVHLHGTRMSCKYGITIEDDAVLEDAAIADTDFHALTADRADAVENPTECRVVIGAGAAIGAWTVIGKGVTIGRRARVIAGSIVRKSVPDDGIVAGNPARAVSE